MKTILKVTVLGSMILALSACSTWDGMSSREKKMVGGAGIGAVAGTLVTDHSAWGTIGGAAVGALVGDQVGKATDKK